MPDMGCRHAETKVIPYLRGELKGSERERIAAHLEGCAGCRDAALAFSALLDELTRSTPTPPELNRGRYRAELRGKLANRVWRRAGENPGVVRWRTQVARLLVVAGLAGVLMLLAVRGGLDHQGPSPDLVAHDETLIGGQLDLLQRYPVIERLELLEDLDVIRDLDRLSAGREG